MKIDFVRSGGFAGIRLAVRIDTEDLPVEDASRIVKLVEDAGFFEFQPPRLDRAPGPDRFEYHLTIESQVWGHNSLVLAESDVPDEMRPLLDYLTDMATRGTHP